MAHPPSPAGDSQPQGIRILPNHNRISTGSEGRIRSEKHTRLYAVVPSKSWWTLALPVQRATFSELSAVEGWEQAVEAIDPELSVSESFTKGSSLERWSPGGCER